MLQGAQILQRVTVHPNHVCEPARCERADVPRHADGSGAPESGRTDRSGRIQADRRELLELACVRAVRNHARVGADDWVAVPYNNGGLVVNAKSLELKKGKMWIQMQIVNNTGKMVTFNPDQIQAKLPDGNVVTR